MRLANKRNLEKSDVYENLPTDRSEHLHNRINRSENIFICKAVTDSVQCRFTLQLFLVKKTASLFTGFGKRKWTLPEQRTKIPGC